MPLRLAAVALLLAPAALAQPADPPPSTAEIAPGIVLAVDWDPVTADALEVVDEDGDGRPEAVGGCARWAGEYFPNVASADDEIYLREATVTADGRRVPLDTQCIGAYDWSLESPTADAFEASRPFADVVEVTLVLNWDASGGSHVTWTVGPDGVVRGASWRYEERGLGTDLRDALGATAAARAALGQALAAAVAAERVADQARALAERRRAALRRSAERARAMIAETGAVLDSIGVAVPAPPPTAGAPLALHACAIAPDSTDRVEPGAGATFSARVETAEAAVAWVDFGDGTTDLVGVEGGALWVPHVYAYPGAYRATVTAVDPGGSETCAVDVVVGDGEDPFCADVAELNPVYFGVRSADPADGTEARLDENAEVLRRCPSLCAQVVGYGDGLDVGETSDERAEAVRQGYLARGVAAGRLRAEGRGEGPDCFPVGDPGPGDARCRRVESAPVACAELR